VNNVGAVDVLEPSQYLIKEELAVLVRQLLIAFDDCCQVGFHQLRNDIAA
jgi:hypothetical protein